MNLERILRMVVCYWSEADECYVCDCAIFPTVVGMGDTVQEAHDHFSEQLQITHQKFEAGTLTTSQFVAGKDDVPRAKLNVKINQDTERVLFDLRNQFECPDDQAIDFLAHFYTRARLLEKP